ncbi:hypothetical protein PHMEG_00032805, partial [Phytophthora megakarya]
ESDASGSDVSEIDDSPKEKPAEKAKRALTILPANSEVAGEVSTSWRLIDKLSPQLHVDDVEENLLFKARTETNRVAKKLLVRIFTEVSASGTMAGILFSLTNKYLPALKHEILSAGAIRNALQTIF